MLENHGSEQRDAQRPGPGRLRLRVAVPDRMVLDEEVLSVRARDFSGEFGVQPGFVSFYTCLDIGILTWVLPGGTEKFAAVRRGVMTVNNNVVNVVTRDAVVREALENLETEVLTEFVKRDDQEKTSQTAMTRMQLAAMRQLVNYEAAES